MIETLRKPIVDLVDGSDKVATLIDSEQGSVLHAKLLAAGFHLRLQFLRARGGINIGCLHSEIACHQSFFLQLLNQPGDGARTQLQFLSYKSGLYAGLLEHRHQNVGMTRGQPDFLPAFGGQLLYLPGKCVAGKINAVIVSALRCFHPFKSIFFDLYMQMEIWLILTRVKPVNRI